MHDPQSIVFNSVRALMQGMLTIRDDPDVEVPPHMNACCLHAHIRASAHGCLPDCMHTSVHAHAKRLIGRRRNEFPSK